MPSYRHELHQSSPVKLSVAPDRRAAAGGDDGGRPALAFLMALLAVAVASIVAVVLLLRFVAVRSAPPAREPRRSPPSGVRPQPSKLKQTSPASAAAPLSPPRPSAAPFAPSVSGLERYAAAATVEEECEIEWFRGYVKSQFYAVTRRSDGLPCVLESPWFSWRQVSPPPYEPSIVAAHDELLGALRREGWELCGRGDEWYCDRLTRTVFA